MSPHTRIMTLSLVLSSILVTLPALAVPTSDGAALATDATHAQPATLNDPQVMPAPASPFMYPAANNTGNIPTNPTTSDTTPPLSQPLPNPLNNPDTLASQMQPTDNTLSQANQELLSRNALLQRDVNDLQTQVNVLVEERSGQLFMYGAFTVAVSLMLGFFIGWFVFGRRDRW